MVDDIETLQLKPEAPQWTPRRPATGDSVCDACAGSGTIRDEPCAVCGGTGHLPLPAGGV